MEIDSKERRAARLSQDSEKVIERHLRRRVAALGGLCLKYANAAECGYPDRLCLMPGGRVMFVEVKSRGCKPNALQRVRHSQLAALGVMVRVVDSIEAADAAVEEAMA